MAFSSHAMGVSDERAEWLARNLFPHEASIRVWLARRVGVGIEIDDIIHDMYAKFIMLPSVGQIENPRRYALRMAYSLVVDQVRHAKVIPIATLSEDQHLDVASGDPSIEERLLHRSDLQRLDSVLATLPPLCRQAFLLRRVDGLSQRETAAKLKISEKTVEKYMSRTVRLIMEVFGRGGKTVSNPSYGIGNKHANNGKKRTGD